MLQEAEEHAHLIAVPARGHGPLYPEKTIIARADDRSHLSGIRLPLSDAATHHLGVALTIEDADALDHVLHLAQTDDLYHVRGVPNHEGAVLETAEVEVSRPLVVVVGDVGMMDGTGVD